MNVAVLAPSSTVTQDVYQRLRADLLACRLPPGQKLKIDDLCQRLSTGSSAAREAVSNASLEWEGDLISALHRLCNLSASAIRHGLQDSHPEARS